MVTLMQSTEMVELKMKTKILSLKKEVIRPGETRSITTLSMLMEIFSSFMRTANALSKMILSLKKKNVIKKPYLLGGMLKASPTKTGTPNTRSSTTVLFSTPMEQLSSSTEVRPLLFHGLKIRDPNLQHRSSSITVLHTMSSKTRLLSMMTVKLSAKTVTKRLVLKTTFLPF